MRVAEVEASAACAEAFDFPLGVSITRRTVYSYSKRASPSSPGVSR
jgi:hypothetical protein